MAAFSWVLIGLLGGSAVWITLGFVNLTAPWLDFLLATLVTLLLATRSSKSTKLKPCMDGFVRPGFEPVRDVFSRLVQGGYSGAFSVYQRGVCVVDLWGGYADPEADLPWREDTIACAFSVTKGLCAICIAHLVDRGLLDYSEPVCKYWPEFGQNGKDMITLQDLVSHQAGLVLLDEDFTISLLKDNPDRLAAAMARQRPQWEPGAAQGYHILSFGLYINELIRRVDPKRRNVHLYFKEEFAEKYDLDFEIGLPVERSYLCARLGSMHLPLWVRLTIHWPMLAWFITATPRDILFGQNLFFRAMKNPSDFILQSVNNPYFREYPFGSVCGFGSARSLARLYGLLTDGRALAASTAPLSRQQLEGLASPVCTGFDRTLLMTSIWARGTTLFKQPIPGQQHGDHYMFGHPGAGGQVGMADVQRQLGWGHLSNQFNIWHGYIFDHRYMELQDVMYRCVTNLEKTE